MATAWRTCVRSGEDGRGNGALVLVEKLRRWLDQRRAVDEEPASVGLATLEQLLRDYHRAGDHRLVGLRDEPARLYLAALLEYVTARAGWREHLDAAKSASDFLDWLRAVAPPEN